ncbi:MAG: hypothetical protein A2X86_15310 [Bdellovibrionales bacterium GWA2_49_15]|nr:MAG: hypothetical protein A2X86_15310 [Bdellovibrionales bacterium GWA2_49_15]HAZ13130.1 hypothetical protein [Bdellovibrionales bacterium]
MKKLTVFLLTFTLFSTPAWAKNIAIMGAASGQCVDLAKGQDYFEKDTRFMSNAMKKMGWETTTFTGNPREGESEFMLNTFMQSLNQAGSGDQLFINLNTHGSREQEGFSGAPGAVHSICFQGPGGEQHWVSMRTIKEKIAQLASQGVKVAVLDSSCYGGGAISQLAGENVCVVSGTTANLTNQGNDVSLSMVAQLAVKKLPRGEQDELFQNYPMPGLSALRANGVGARMSVDVSQSEGVSMENLFLNARTFGAFGHEHMPAQISSDVEGYGHSLGRALAPLGLAPEYAVTRAGVINSSMSANVIEAVVASNMQGGDARAYYDKYSCATFDNPFWQVEDFIDQIKTVLAQKKLRNEVLSEDEVLMARTLQRLGFNSLEDAQKKMRAYVNERVRLYNEIKILAARIQAYDQDRLPDGKFPPDITRLRKADLKKMEKAYLDHARLNANSLSERLDKAYYLAQYIAQRKTTHEDPKARACADFKF